jgi:hypothetical protein
MIGLKKGQLIDYGRVSGARGMGIGWILGIVGALLLFPLALAFAARKCTQGACIPGGARAGYVPVMTGASGVTQTENGQISLDRSTCKYPRFSFQHCMRVRALVPLAIFN